jgi:hypothetical protein
MSISDARCFHIDIFPGDFARKQLLSGCGKLVAQMSVQSRFSLRSSSAADHADDNLEMRTRN